MALPVSLAEFVDELDSVSEEWHVLLNRRTGEFLTVTEDDTMAIDDEEDDDPPSWQDPDRARKVREAMSSDDWLQLPSKYELDEYRIMRDFCGAVDNETLAADLCDTIGGRGTFGRWKGMLHRHGMLDDWYRFRSEALRRIAIDWLEAHKIPYQQ